MPSDCLKNLAEAVAEEITPGHHPDCFRDDRRRAGVARAGNGRRLSLFDERGPGWRGAAAAAARAARGPAHSVERAAADRDTCGRGAGQDTRRTCGPSLPRSKSRACATRCWMRGCSARDFQTAQNRHRRARGIGKNRAGRIALHAPEIGLSTRRDHERYLHARRRGISHAARRAFSRPDRRRRNRRLPAHRDPRGRFGEPRSLERAHAAVSRTWIFCSSRAAETIWPPRSARNWSTPRST